MYQTTPCPAVAPRSEMSTRLRFSHFPKASFSGCAEVIPALLMEAKIGDSFIFSRIYSEILTRIIESRNGIRQPHAEKASLLIQDWVTRITIRETNKPNVAVIWMKLV